MGERAQDVQEGQPRHAGSGDGVVLAAPSVGVPGEPGGGGQGLAFGGLARQDVVDGPDLAQGGPALRAAPPAVLHCEPGGRLAQGLVVAVLRLVVGEHVLGARALGRGTPLGRCRESVDGHREAQHRADVRCHAGEQVRLGEAGEGAGDGLAEELLGGRDGGGGVPGGRGVPGVPRFGVRLRPGGGGLLVPFGHGLGAGAQEVARLLVGQRPQQRGRGLVAWPQGVPEVRRRDEPCAGGELAAPLQRRHLAHLVAAGRVQDDLAELGGGDEFGAPGQPQPSERNAPHPHGGQGDGPAVRRARDGARLVPLALGAHPPAEDRAVGAERAVLQSGLEGQHRAVLLLQGGALADPGAQEGGQRGA